MKGPPWRELERGISSTTKSMSSRGSLSELEEEGVVSELFSTWGRTEGRGGDLWKRKTTTEERLKKKKRTPSKKNYPVGPRSALRFSREVQEGETPHPNPPNPPPKTPTPTRPLETELRKGATSSQTNRTQGLTETRRVGKGLTRS